MQLEVEMKASFGSYLASPIGFVLSFFCSVEAINFSLFPYCTETHHVDSSAFTHWPNGSGDSVKAPSRGWATRTYHPNSCLLAVERIQPIGSDRIYLNETKSRQDGFVRYSGWEETRETLPGIWSLVWLGPEGFEDSLFAFTDSNDFDEMDKAVQIMRRVKTQGLLVLENHHRDSSGALGLFSQDSVFSKGNKTVIHSLDHGERFKTTCTDDGRAVVCIPEYLREINSTKWNKQIWYYTANRLDSVLTYNSNQSLLTLERYFWSERAPSAIRYGKRYPTQSLFQPSPSTVNVLGQRLRILRKTRP